MIKRREYVYATVNDGGHGQGWYESVRDAVKTHKYTAVGTFWLPTDALHLVVKTWPGYTDLAIEIDGFSEFKPAFRDGTLAGYIVRFEIRELREDDDEL